MGIFSECEYFFKANLYNLIHKMTQNHTLPVDMTTATFQQFSSSGSCMYYLTDTVCTFISTLYFYSNYVSSSWSKLAGYCSNKITFQESDIEFSSFPLGGTTENVWGFVLLLPWLCRLSATSGALQNIRHMVALVKHGLYSYTLLLF